MYFLIGIPDEEIFSVWTKRKLVTFDALKELPGMNIP